MTGLVPYVFFPGNAAEALTFYRDAFGGELIMHSYADFGRSDGPGDAIAHGILTGAVALFGADAGPHDDGVHLVGVDFSLLGAAEPAVLAQWFERLSDGGRVVSPLEQRPWGAHDGTVVDRFGLRWLIGWEELGADPPTS